MPTQGLTNLAGGRSQSLSEGNTDWVSGEKVFGNEGMMKQNHFLELQGLAILHAPYGGPGKQRSQ